MDFAFPSHVEEFRGELRSFLDANLTPDIVAAGRPDREGDSDEDFELCRAWNRQMADAGYGAIAWPEEYGGRGAGLLEQVVYYEEITKAGAPMPVNILGMSNIAPAIMSFGSAAQCHALLPKMLRGDDVWCQGMSEPEAGSDLASLRTRAVPDGDTFVVNGQKIWTSFASRANWCELFVRTDPDAPKHAGISCLLVDMTLDGIVVRPLRTIAGGSHFNEMFFDEVRVPADALLGPLNEGWQVAISTLAHERAGAANLYVMVQEKLRELVVALAGRTADGQRLLDNENVVRRIGELSMEVRQLELLVTRSIAAALHGGDATGQGSLSKTVWGELDQAIAAFSSEVLGTVALTGSWASNRLNSRSMTIAGGTTQINTGIVARYGLGLPKT
jgi:alkylation response protein AidB-like acyl-CoA dehydrogenase